MIRHFFYKIKLKIIFTKKIVYTTNTVAVISKIQHHYL